MKKIFKNFFKIHYFMNVEVMVTAALFAAMSIICGKFLAIPIGNTLRISVENLPIMLSGILFGPVVGAFTGIVADILGCFLRGYAIIPLVTVASALVGFLAGTIYEIFKKNNVLALILTSAICHTVCSVIIKTPALSNVFGTPYPILLTQRIGIYIFVAAAECAAMIIITKNKAFLKQIKKITGAHGNE